MNNKEQVVPDVVVFVLMLQEAVLHLAIKALRVLIANEALVPLVFHPGRVLVSQLCKGIDDDTEDNVQQNSHNQEEERQIEDGAEVEALRVRIDSRLRGQELADTAATSQSVVHCRQEAVEHGHAGRVSFAIEQA